MSQKYDAGGGKNSTAAANGAATIYLIHSK